MERSIGAALKAAGIKFIDAAVRPRPYGWTPQVVAWHHTASAAGRDAPSLRTVRFGRPGLSGPLCHILISRQGVVYLICDWGWANHAGAVNCGVEADLRQGNRIKGAAAYGCSNGCGGNGWSIGIEVENNGTGEPYSEACYDKQVEVGAALAAYFNIDPITRHIDHQELTCRKIDRGTPLSRGSEPKTRDQFRSDVANYNGGQAPQEDDDLTPEQAQQLQVIHDALVTDEDGVRHISNNITRHNQELLDALTARVSTLEAGLTAILNAVQLVEGDTVHTNINTSRFNQEQLNKLVDFVESLP